MMTLAPLGAIAYLCTSQEILHRVKEGRAPGLGNQRLRFLGSNAPLKRKMPGSRSSPRHSRNSEVKRNGLEPSPFEERDEERTEAAVDVQAEPVPDRQVRKRRDVCSSNRVPSPERECVCVCQLYSEKSVVVRRAATPESNFREDSPSMAPSGKLGADPTNKMVLALMALLTFAIWTRRVTGSTGMWWILIPK